MSYTEDTAYVLESMGYVDSRPDWPVDKPRWWTSHVGLQAVLTIDANFVVERVIPWAIAQGFEFEIAWSAEELQVIVRRADGEMVGVSEVPTMPEAVMAAIAAALRSEK